MSLLYIDPGSTSMVVQALIGIGLGAVVFFKNIKNSVLGVFRKKEKPTPPDH